MSTEECGYKNKERILISFSINTHSLKHFVHWICTSILFTVSKASFPSDIYLNLLNSVVLSTTFDNTLDYHVCFIHFYKLTFIKMVS